MKLKEWCVENFRHLAELKLELYLKPTSLHIDVQNVVLRHIRRSAAAFLKLMSCTS